MRMIVEMPDNYAVAIADGEGGPLHFTTDLASGPVPMRMVGPAVETLSVEDLLEMRAVLNTSRYVWLTICELTERDPDSDVEAVLDELRLLHNTVVESGTYDGI